MKYPILALLPGCAAMLLACSTVCADIYQWTDKDGQVHYGDKAARAANAGLSAEKLPIKDEAGAVDPAAERNREQLRTLHQRYDAARAAEASNFEQLQRKNVRRQEYCKQLGNRIRLEQEVAVMFSYDDAGKRVSWTAAERDAYRQQLEASNQQHCGAES